MRRVDASGLSQIQSVHEDNATLEGEQADAYAKAVAAGLEAGIPAGMTKLCRTIEDAARFDKPSISGG